MSTDKEKAERQIYYIKAGDRAPSLILKLYNEDGSVKDLTGIDEIRLVVAKVVGGRRLVDDQMAHIYGGDPKDGQIIYFWKHEELEAGEYLMEVRVKNPVSSGPITYDYLWETFPKSGYLKLFVLPRL